MSGNWKIKKLGEVMDIARGGSPRPIKKYLTDSPDGINWIKISDATSSSKYIYKTNQKIIKEGLSKSRLVEEGDFLLSNSMSFGRPYIMKTSGCIHDGWLVLKHKQKNVLNQDYLFHLLGSPYIFNEFDRLAAGSTVRNLNISLVSSVEVPIPPLEEQKQIVAILDKAFDAIDKAKANIQRNIENAQELFQSKLNEIFSQKGDGWEEKTFKDVCVLQRGFDLPKRLRQKGHYDLVSSSGIIDSHSEFKVHGPGVVTGRSGSIGNVFYLNNSFWPLNTTLYIKDFKGNKEKYIYYFLKSFDLSKYSSGAGVPTLNRNFVHDEKVQSTNDLELQKDIAETLDSIDSKINGIVNLYMTKISMLKEIKQSILQKAFTGELTSAKQVAH